MSIGSIVRTAAGPFEKQLCALYRSVFINVRRCMDQLQEAIPNGSSVIDVGGGDGELLNYLLHLRPDINVVMLDLRKNIGAFLEPDVRDRVVLRPATSLASYRSESGELADVLIVSDVVHHVPATLRREFIDDCVSMTKTGGTLIIKEVAPGGFVAALSVLADRYITGDRHVSLMAPSDLSALVESAGCIRVGELLASRELPNYAVAFRASREPY